MLSRVRSSAVIGMLRKQEYIAEAGVRSSFYVAVIASAAPKKGAGLETVVT
jgi:hypothetical protein